MMAKALRTAVLAGVAWAFGFAAAGEAQYPLKTLNEGDYAVYAVTKTVMYEGGEEILEGTWRYSVTEKTDEEVTIEKTIEWRGTDPDTWVGSRTYPLNRAASPALLYDIINFDDKLTVTEMKVTGSGTEVMYADGSEEESGEDEETWFWISLQVVLSAEEEDTTPNTMTMKIFLHKEIPFLNVVRIESEQVVEYVDEKATVVFEMDFIEGGSDE